MGQQTTRHLAPEIRVGRNFIRQGDAVKVKLPPSTTFSDGFRFVGYDERESKAIVLWLKYGHERYVSVAGIRRKAVTKGGERR